MDEYKQSFIEFMINNDVLRFGEFTLKSGRKSPFFLNMGKFVSGESLLRLGEYYARAIEKHFGLDFDVLFGPAYKGIPIGVATAIAMKSVFDADVSYCANRKEIKDHGDAGMFLGKAPESGDRIVMIEDVTTSGKSMEETVPLIRGVADVEMKGLIVSVDRMEVGRGGRRSALEEVEEIYGFPTASIVTMEEVTDYLSCHEVNGRKVIGEEMLCRIEDYYKKYGSKEGNRDE